MDTNTPKERLLISLRKGNAEKVAAIIKQFPGIIKINLQVTLVGQSVAVLSVLIFHLLLFLTISLFSFAARVHLYPTFMAIFGTLAFFQPADMLLDLLSIHIHFSHK